MLGVVVVFIVSWLLLWFIVKEHITILGFKPTNQRLMEFAMGFMFMAICCAFNLLGQAYFQEISYVRNPDYGWWDALSGTGWTARAALFEELIFRGAILYLLIRWIGIVKACILAGIAFGIYHWFSYEMFGRGFVPMTYVFLLTGASGWMFAYAFAKTKSLYAPFGLHLGWILISIVGFSEGPLGSQLFMPQGDAIELEGWTTLLFFLWQTVIIPGLVTWYIVRSYVGSNWNYDD